MSKYNFDTFSESLPPTPARSSTLTCGAINGTARRCADGNLASAFAAKGNGKWLANLYELARQRLHKLGIRDIFGGDYCTVEDAARFYSYRRDGATGRMASLIWLEAS